MNITFLIGNGFDLNIGLATTYSAFLKEYTK
ncbi:MAG: tryptophan synthase subunit beta, partial [Firmicutes bacterium]|nr:tryptophan synthase subunit beta [Bacillota bacterium]